MALWSLRVQPEEEVDFLVGCSLSWAPSGQVAAVCFACESWVCLVLPCTSEPLLHLDMWDLKRPDLVFNICWAPCSSKFLLFWESMCVVCYLDGTFAEVQTLASDQQSVHWGWSGLCLLRGELQWRSFRHDLLQEPYQRIRLSPMGSSLYEHRMRCGDTIEVFSQPLVCSPDGVHLACVIATVPLVKDRDEQVSKLNLAVVSSETGSILLQQPISRLATQAYWGKPCLGPYLRIAWSDSGAVLACSDPTGAWHMTLSFM